MAWNFAKLAEISTGRAPKLKGLLPSFGSLVSLLVVAGLIASGMWLWTSFWAGAFASASAYVPFLGKALAGVLGMTALNFWFSREINTFALSTREVRKDFVYSQTENPTPLYKLVDHLRHEVNIHFRETYGAQNDIPMPRLLTYTKNDAIEISSEGRNPGKAGIFFSTGCFEYGKTNLDQRQLAALIQMELVKIYLSRNASRTFVSMSSSLLNTLQNFNNSDYFFLKALGVLTGPLQLVLLLERSINRSYEYEAAEHVAAMGHGLDLMNGIDKKVCEALETIPTNVDLKATQKDHKREPYNGYFKSIISPITNWIDDNEYEGDDKTGYRILSLPDILVREGGFYINELFKDKPRATNLKNYLRTLIKGTFNGKEISVGDATTAQLPEMQRQQMEKNRVLYEQILPETARYEVIGPDGTGYVAPVLAKNQPIPANHYQALFGGITITHVQQQQQQRQQQQRRGRGQRQDEAQVRAHPMTLRNK